jgi:cysteine desulfurase/selenocysteine lyase
VLKVAPVTDAGELDLDAFGRLLGARTRIVAMAHVSNALGTINPVVALVARAHAVGAVVLLDGAQAVPHLHVDVRAIACDFYAFSGHKMYGPTGIGVLYGRRELLEQMPPWQGGGEMIRAVSFAGTSYAPPPARFEGGDARHRRRRRPRRGHRLSAGARPRAHRPRRALPFSNTRRRACPLFRVCASSARRATSPPCSRSRSTGFIRTTSAPCSIITASPCARDTTAPCRSWSASACRRTTRASFAFYNTRAEVDQLIDALHDAREVLG